MKAAIRELGDDLVLYIVPSPSRISQDRCGREVGKVVTVLLSGATIFAERLWSAVISKARIIVLKPPVPTRRDRPSVGHVIPTKVRSYVPRTAHRAPNRTSRPC